MDLDPQKVFVGLVDFFSVLMPGGFLSYLARPWIASHILRGSQIQWNVTEGWMVFLFCSYLLGHFIFLLGSMLDQFVYDPFRRLAYWGQIERLANGKNLSSSPLRAAAESKLFFSRTADKAVIQTERLKSRVFNTISASEAVNAFQWCKAVLSVLHPAGLVTVERLEADSKFFRSFVVVSLILLLYYGVHLKFELALIYLVMLILALWRYVDQRSKASQRAYWLVMVYEASKGPLVLHTEPLKRKDGLTHAGGVLFRTTDNGVEYLLVQASGSRHVWVLPKGKIEPGEDPRKTAVREVSEETGYWARVENWLGDFNFGEGERPQVGRIYLMQVEKEAEKKKWPPENRQFQWLSLDAAKDLASFQETKDLLENLTSWKMRVKQPKTASR
jgi:8-oxo-dGTP pyrophosphatase MutT (NUDIX family)